MLQCIGLLIIQRCLLRPVNHAGAVEVDRELHVNVRLADFFCEDGKCMLLGCDKQRIMLVAKLDLDMHAALGSVVVDEVRVEELGIIPLRRDHRNLDQ